MNFFLCRKYVIDQKRLNVLDSSISLVTFKKNPKYLPN